MAADEFETEVIAALQRDTEWTPKELARFKAMEQARLDQIRAEVEVLERLLTEKRRSMATMEKIVRDH